MAGGLMQLVAYGAQDVYLTSNPQLTFFRVDYRRNNNRVVEEVVREPVRTIVKYNTIQESDEFDQRECVICLEKYQDEEMVIVLGCGHIYHQSCNDDSIRCCPVCRK